MIIELPDILSVVNFALVFLFGVFLSVSFAGGCRSRQDWAVLFALCSVCLALQTVLYLTFGLYTSKRLYPLYIHLPMLLGLTLGLKRPVGISLVSICTAYLCCQIPRCGGIVTAAATKSELTGSIVYTLIIAPIFLLLRLYFVPSARDIMTESPKSPLLFGSMPIIYYVYDYTIALRFNLPSSNFLPSAHTYSGLQMTAEILPAVVGLLYMLYAAAYRQQLHRLTQAELLSSVMAGQLKQAETEIGSLRRAEAQAAAYQHDMRHHLTAIDAFLTAGSPEQALAYIKKVGTGIDVITPKRFCENELVNLLCSSFSAKAERMGVRLKVEAVVPGSLPVSDTELCALLSNGLENALNAVGPLEKALRWVEFYCHVRLDKLLIEVRNPYTGQITFQDGLPVASQPHHGYGCRSIRTITQSYQGMCEFSAESQIFTLRVALPCGSAQEAALSPGMTYTKLL